MVGVLNVTTGSWSSHLEAGNSPAATFLNSHKQETRASLQYSEDDLKQIEKWGKFYLINMAGDAAFFSNYAF